MGNFQNLNQNWYFCCLYSLQGQLNIKGTQGKVFLREKSNFKATPSYLLYLAGRRVASLYESSYQLNLWYFSRSQNMENEIPVGYRERKRMLVVDMYLQYFVTLHTQGYRPNGNSQRPYIFNPLQKKLLPRRATLPRCCET